MKILDETSSLLIHVTFHFYDEDYCKCCKKYTNSKTRNYTNEERFAILFRVLQTFSLYPCKKVIVVDTNHKEVEQRLKDFGFVEHVQIKVHTELQHPWLLTWQHRTSFLELLDTFDFFFYTEDDMIIPFENLQKYYERMEELWPNQVASFVRFEQLDSETKLCVDAISKSKRLYSQIRHDKYINLNNDYCACWGMEREMLRESLQNTFLYSSSIKPHEIRIQAASWPSLQLGKIGCIEIDKNCKIKPFCLIEHATRNYIRFPNKPFCTLNVDELFEFTEEAIVSTSEVLN